MFDVDVFVQTKSIKQNTAVYHVTLFTVKSEQYSVHQLAFPANTRHSPNAGLMMGQRRRRWDNNQPVLFN